LILVPAPLVGGPRVCTSDQTSVSALILSAIAERSGLVHAAVPIRRAPAVKSRALTLPGRAAADWLIGVSVDVSRASRRSAAVDHGLWLAHACEPSLGPVAMISGALADPIVTQPVRRDGHDQRRVASRYSTHPAARSRMGLPAHSEQEAHCNQISAHRAKHGGAHIEEDTRPGHTAVEVATSASFYRVIGCRRQVLHETTQAIVSYSA
jgi:hypothetical protein